MADTQKRGRKFESPGHYTDKDRETIDEADFGDPTGRKFPIITQADVHDAASLIGKAGDPAAVKARIKAIAKRKGFALPKAWQDEEDQGGRAAQPADAERAGGANVAGEARVPSGAGAGEWTGGSGAGAPTGHAHAGHGHPHTHGVGAQHAHAHPHAHRDGTTHAHAHTHGHAHHVKRAAGDDGMGDGGGELRHDHNHVHLHDHDHTLRAADADVVRSADAGPEGADSMTDIAQTATDEVQRIFVAPISRVDPEKRQVTVTATSEAVDTYGTIFDYDASKRAFLKWVGNVREMHQPKAVGSRVAVHCDDENRKIDVTLRISRGAQDTWEKVLDGTLKGASIGASKVMWQHPATRDKGTAHPRAVDYDLAELSLVDNPSNPDSLGIMFVRSAQPDTSLLDVIEDVIESAEERASRESAEERASREASEAAEEFTAAAVADLTREMASPVPGMPPAVAAATGMTLAQAATSPDVLAAVAAALPALPATTPSALPPTGEASAARGLALAEAARAAGMPTAGDVQPDRTQVDPAIYASHVERERAARAKDAYLEAARAAVRAEISPFDEYRENYDAYVSRVRTATAGAEARAILEWQAGQRAASAATPVVALPPEASEPVAPVHVVAPVVPVVAVGAEEARAAFVTGEVATAPLGAPAIPGTPQAEVAGGREEHVNLRDGEHEHQMADGSRMRHRHPHIDGRHSHVYRSGVPTDARLVTADDLRAPFGTQQTEDQRPVLKGVHDTGQLKIGGGAKVAGGAPAGGKATSPVLTVQPQAVGKRVLYNTQDAASLDAGVPTAAEERPSPTDDISLNPDQFHEGGHSTAVAHGESTGDYDADGDHDGAAEDAADAPKGPGAPAPTAMRPARPTAKNSGRPAGYGQVNTVGGRASSASALAIQTLLDAGVIGEEQAGQMRAAAGANEANYGQVTDDGAGAEPPAEDDDSDEYAGAEGDDGDADDGRTPARPPRATDLAHDAAPTPKVGKSPADTGLAVKAAGPQPNGGPAAASASKGVAGGLQRAAAQSAASRAGARLSDQSRREIHSMRDAQMEAVRRACVHCNGDGECPDCASLLAVLDAGQYNGVGSHIAPGSPDVSSDTSQFGSLRVLAALVTRALSDQFIPHFAALRSEISETRAAFLEATEELRTALADAQLTLADTTRMSAADVARGFHDGLQTRLEEALARNGDALGQRLERVAEDASGLRAVVSETRDLVARIADQPAVMQAPQGPGAVADKRLPLGLEASAPAAGGALTRDQEMAALANMATGLSPTDPMRTTIAGRMAQLSARHYSPTLGPTGR